MSYANRNVRSSAGKKVPFPRCKRRRLDTRLYLRPESQYLHSEALGKARSSGALPPRPWSLAHGQTPAPGRWKKGPAELTAEPCAVRLASGRSGRTPAEPARQRTGKPCPPEGAQRLPCTRPYRPAPGHPWRNSHEGTTGTPLSDIDSGRQEGLTAPPTGAILGTRVVPFWARALVPLHLRITTCTRFSF